MEQLELFSTSPSTSSQGERLVRTSARPGKDAGSTLTDGRRAPASRSTSCALPENYPLGMLYGRMWRELSTARTPPTSSDSSVRLGSAGILSRGACWTRSMCEWTAWSVACRRDAGVCGLSDVLEPMSPSLLKYFLSPTALQGILRRADARGKALPTLLRDAIAYMLEWWAAHPELSRQSQEPSNDDTIQASAPTEG